MRKPAFLLVVSLVVLTAATATAQSVRSTLDNLADTWIESLLTEDADAMIECYWPDAVHYSYSGNGETELLVGSAEYAAAQQQAFDELDYASFGLVYPEPVRFFPEFGAPVYVYAVTQFRFMDVFEFERRGNEWRIIRHFFYSDPVPGE
jgi:hypothetical protein